jgi:hypothetical protein
MYNAASNAGKNMKEAMEIAENLLKELRLEGRDESSTR